MELMEWDAQVAADTSGLLKSGEDPPLVLREGSSELKEKREKH